MNICPRNLVPLISALFFFLGCSCHHNPNFWENKKPENQIVCSDLSGANREICEVLQNEVPCETLEKCDTVNVSLTPKEPTQQSLGQRILIIDAETAFPAYTRYKSRVLAHLAPNELGVYQKENREIQIPRVVYTVLSEILDEKYPDLPAIKLDAIEGLYLKHTRLLNHLMHHGVTTMATLADHNPNAELIIADLFRAPKDLCKFSDDSNSRNRLKIFLQNAANSLADAIDKYDINFVNMSFGDSVKVVRNEWQWNCPNQAVPPDAVLQLITGFYDEHFYQPLFSQRKVVFVQSGPSSTRSLEKNDPDFYIDCQDVDNRLRVAAFASEDSNLPILGADEADLLTEHLKGPWQCIDFYVSLGTSPNVPYNPGKYPSMFTREGIGASPNGRPHNSDAAPLGLSYLIFLKNSGLVKGDGAEFVSNFKSYLQGKLVDPYRYQQFDFFRLGRI